MAHLIDYEEERDWYLTVLLVNKDWASRVHEGTIFSLLQQRDLVVPTNSSFR
jgi:hypothetical protein